MNNFEFPKPRATVPSQSTIYSRHYFQIICVFSSPHKHRSRDRWRGDGNLFSFLFCGTSQLCLLFTNSLPAMIEWINRRFFFFFVFFFNERNSRSILEVFSSLEWYLFVTTTHTVHHGTKDIHIRLLIGECETGMRNSRQYVQYDNICDK